ncbi:MAG: MFS transporter [Candidatus Omnitrophota bacterium]
MEKIFTQLKQNPFLKSLQVSWKEGIPASVMQSLAEDYFIPLALFLCATPLQIGLLVAVPTLVSSVIQLWTSKAVDLIGSRLRCLVTTAAGQAFCLLPIVFLPFLAGAWRIGAFIVFVTLFRTFGSLISTVWGSLASDYLPAEERGRYFGWRSRVVGIAGILGTVWGGLLLFSYRGKLQAAGFMILVAVATLARFLSAGLMTRMQDLPAVEKPGDHFTFLMFLRRFRQSNFVKFVFYVASIMFATNLAAPFFSVYMLHDLHFNYFLFMTIRFASIVAGLVSFPIWGRHADAVGNAKILKLTSLLIPAIPLLWTISPLPAYLICVEIFSGFVWGGFNLCALNFIYEAVSSGKRIRCLSYFAFINGIAIFLGAAAGGFLVERLPSFRGSAILTVFLISGALRLLSHFILSKKFREVRLVAQKISSLELFFSVTGIRQLGGRNKS